MWSGCCSDITELVLVCVRSVQTDSFIALALHFLNLSIIQSQTASLSSPYFSSSTATGSHFLSLCMSECKHTCMSFCVQNEMREKCIRKIKKESVVRVMFEERKQTGEMKRTAGISRRRTVFNPLSQCRQFIPHLMFSSNILIFYTLQSSLKQICVPALCIF